MRIIKLITALMIFFELSFLILLLFISALYVITDGHEFDATYKEWIIIIVFFTLAITASAILARKIYLYFERIERRSFLVVSIFIISIFVFMISSLNVSTFVLF